MRGKAKLVLGFAFLFVIIGLALGADVFSPVGGESVDDALYLAFLSGGLAALAIYYKVTFLDKKTPDMFQYEAALADFSRLKYHKDIDQLTDEELFNLRKEFIEVFGGYTTFTEREVNYAKNVDVPSPLPSWEEFGVSVATGAAVGAAVGALGFGVGAIPGAILGAIGGAVFSIVSHVVGWGLMQVRKAGLESRGDPMLVTVDERGFEKTYYNGQTAYIPPSETIIGSRDEDTKHYAGIAKIVGLITGFLATIGVSSVAEGLLGVGKTASAAGMVDDVANTADDLANNADEVANAMDDMANSADDAANSMDDVANSADDIGNNMDDIAGSADDAANAADDIVDELDLFMKKLREYGDDEAVRLTEEVKNKIGDGIKNSDGFKQVISAKNKDSIQSAINSWKSEAKTFLNLEDAKFIDKSPGDIIGKLNGKKVYVEVKSSLNSLDGKLNNNYINNLIKNAREAGADPAIVVERKGSVSLEAFSVLKDKGISLYQVTDGGLKPLIIP